MPWARVHLTSGRSSGDLWEVDPSTAGARIDVGSSINCVWQVHAPGVAPFHLEMYWDGEVLWVADLEGSGVRIDGQLVDDWYATAHESRIEFGKATMRVETSHATRMGDDRLPEPTSGETSIEHGPMPDGPTRIEGGGQSEVHGAPTRVVTGRNERALDGILDRLTSPAEVDLRVGDDAATDPQPIPREATAAVFGGAAAEDPLATRLVQTPETRLAGAPGVPIHRRPPPPRIGEGARNVQHTGSPPAPLPPPAARPKSVPPPPPPSSMPPPSQPAWGSAPPAPPPPSTPPSTPPMPQTPPTSTPSGPPGSEARAEGTPAKPRFAAPPPLGFTDAQGQEGAAPARRGKREMSLPPRTWALLGATVLALAYVILMDDAPPPDTPPTPVAATASGGAEEAADGTAEDPAGDAPAEARKRAADDGEAVNGQDDDAAGVAQAGEGDAGDEEPASTPLVKRAADAILGGRRREALRLYEELAARHPDSPAYAAIARILRERSRERCPEGETCT